MAEDLRIENGRDLLKTTDLTVQDVADKVGYKDTAYFSRVFKAKVGLTPTDYKKMVRPKLFQISGDLDRKHPLTDLRSNLVMQKLRKKKRSQ